MAYEATGVRRFMRAHGWLCHMSHATPNANPDAVLDAYIAKNFEWYKANPDMGGKWEIMCSLAIGAASMITVSSGASLNQLRKSGALYSGIPSLIPSQAPEVFFQPNPTRK